MWWVGAGEGRGGGRGRLRRGQTGGAGEGHQAPPPTPRQAVNKKNQEIFREKREVTELLKLHKYDKARIRGEAVYRKEREVEAMEVIELMCELLHERTVSAQSSGSTQGTVSATGAARPAATMVHVSMEDAGAVKARDTPVDTTMTMTTCSRPLVCCGGVVTWVPCGAGNHREGGSVSG